MATHAPAITIRAVTAADERPLLTACYPAQTPVAFAEHFSRLLAWQQNGRACWLVAQAAHELAGSGQLIRYPRVVELANVVITPVFRRQGVGRRLLSALLQTSAARWPALPLEARVLAANAPALALYRGAGFGEHGRLHLPDGPTVVLRLKQSLISNP